VGVTATVDDVRLSVSDTGAGFDVAEATKNRGLGLVSMRERVHLVYGSLSIESRPGIGTSILAIVPIAAAHQRAPVDAAVERDEHHERAIAQTSIWEM
jgi:signal transduction histidine kinase